MSLAIWSGALVLALGAALQPRPQARRPHVPDRPATRARLESLRPGRRGRSRLVGRRRARPPQPDELAVWCDALSRSVRSGATLTAALRAVAAPAAIGREIDDIRFALERGSTLRAALDGVDPASPHLRLAVVVLRACASHGGPSAEPIDRAAAALRMRAALDAERRTQSAQARMSAVVMTLLPISMLALLVATSSSVRAAVVSPAGVVVVVAGAGLNAAGWTWMRRVIESVSR